VTSDDLVTTEGYCSGMAPPPAPSDANALTDDPAGAPTAPATAPTPTGTVGLAHTECDVVRGIVAPVSVTLSNNQPGDRVGDQADPLRRAGRVVGGPEVQRGAVGTERILARPGAGGVLTGQDREAVPVLGVAPDQVGEQARAQLPEGALLCGVAHSGGGGVSIDRARELARALGREVLGRFLASMPAITDFYGVDPHERPISDRTLDLFVAAGTPADVERGLARLLEAGPASVTFSGRLGPDPASAIAMLGRIVG